MTPPQPASIDQPEVYKSLNSGRRIIPGWMNILENVPDGIELQLDIALQNWEREQALVLLEYWETPADITLNSLLPMRVFSETPAGWCALLPTTGRIIIRAMDPAPRPAVLSMHIINIDPLMPRGSVIHAGITFPEDPGVVFLKRTPN